MTPHFFRLAPVAIAILASSTAQAAEFAAWSEREQAVFGLVNLQRSINGLAALIADSRLQTAALAHSQDMAINNFFSHIGTGGTEAKQRISAVGYAWSVAGENIAAGYGRAIVGSSIVEADVVDAAHSVMYGTMNLFEISNYSVDNGGPAFNSWDEVGTGWGSSLWDSWNTFRGTQGGGWMGSPTHRPNVLSAAFTDIGIGYAYSSSAQFQTYWTQDFAAGDTAVVPVPAAVWLFGSALTGLIVAARKRA